MARGLWICRQSRSPAPSSEGRSASLWRQVTLGLLKKKKNNCVRLATPSSMRRVPNDSTGKGPSLLMWASTLTDVTVIYSHAEDFANTLARFGKWAQRRTFHRRKLRGKSFFLIHSPGQGSKCPTKNEVRGKTVLALSLGDHVERGHSIITATSFNTA